MVTFMAFGAMTPFTFMDEGTLVIFDYLQSLMQGQFVNSFASPFVSSALLFFCWKDAADDDPGLSTLKWWFPMQVVICGLLLLIGFSEYYAGKHSSFGVRVQ